jgi:elongation factor 3
MPAAMEPQAAKENVKSAKVLDELMQKLSLSTDAAAILEASQALASFVNGRIEDQDTPTK